MDHKDEATVNGNKSTFASLEEMFQQYGRQQSSKNVTAGLDLTKAITLEQLERLTLPPLPADKPQQNANVSRNLNAFFTITIKQLEVGVPTVQLTIDPSRCTILDLKQKVYDRIKVPVEQQRLIYTGRQLQDVQTVEQSGIRDGSTIHTVLPIRGD